VSRTALIVDDSPVARLALSRLLLQHDLHTETADSAERALEFLKINRPDVIFMDHMMPGMDGLQALEAIKANPATATIPVMMYTSQEGELYVGQARALGAVGVLPKDLKPVEVARVLKALRLIPGDREHDRTGASGEQAQERGDNRRTAELLEELFRQQRAALREEIRQGYERAFAATHTPPAPPPPPPAPLQELASPAVTRRGWARAWAGVFAVTTAMLAYQYLDARRETTALTQRVAELASIAEQNAARAARLEAEPASPALDVSLVEALEWAINLDNGYGFAEVPLDDGRAQRFARLIGLLGEAGFSGTVLLDVHVGRFCMDADANGSVQLASPDAPVTDCDQVGWSSSDAFALGRRQTPGFANNVAAAANSAGIKVETASLSSDQPLFEYPLLVANVTAGEWNETASRNHRIEVRLLADPSTARPTRAFSRARD
jgi:CheY-like chemotaxis protein